MSVNTKHKDYQQNKEIWDLVRDCLRGSNRIKEMGVKYLPDPKSSSGSNLSAGYANYLLRALFYNVTAVTLQGLVGSVFRKPAKFEMPEEMSYMEDNADGSGLGLDIIAKKAYTDAVSIGRCGLLSDFPVSAENVTAKDVEDFNLKGMIQHYPAESIVNWRTKKIGSINVLDLVVLNEKKCIYSNDFTYEEHNMFRVLGLDDENNYYQQEHLQLYDAKNKDFSFVVGDVIYPKKSDGTTFNGIPFTFVGSNDNGVCVNKSPMADLAEVNIAHYRNSADNEEMLFITGQPTLVLSGLNSSWIEDQFKGKIELGAKSVLFLPEGGAAQMMQIMPNQAIKEAMAVKQELMVALGARLISNSNQIESAEAKRLKQGGEASVLSTIAQNVSQAVEKCLKWVAEFNGVDSEEITYHINRDFFDNKIKPEEVKALVELWQQQIIPKSVVRDNLRAGEIINEDLTDDILDSEIESFGATVRNE